MKVKIVVILLHTLIGIGRPGNVLAKSQAKKCFFRDSVDLTNIEPNENGSYLYHNILIPDKKVYEFDFKMGFHDKMQMVKPHPRGCICGKSENRYCVKLCCESEELYDEDVQSCVKYEDNLITSPNLLVTMNNGSVLDVNIFEQFVPQVGLPCNRPVALEPGSETWMLMETGDLNIISERIVLDTNSYCYTPLLNPANDRVEFMPLSCPKLNEATFLLLLNSYGMWLSAVFFILTAIVYLVLKELRRSLRGRLLISYLLVMSVAYIILAIINTSQMQFAAGPCRSMGFIGYFCFMAGFLWLGVLSFDIWTSFSNMQIKADWEKRLFLIYSLFVWGTAAILLIIVIGTQFSGLVPEAYKPGINAEMCWINTIKWSAALYFYIPSLIILLFNIATFTRVCIRIHRERRNVSRLTTKQKFFHENALFTLRLFLIMGISWIMDIISYCLRNFSWAEYIFAFTDFYNAIQGVCVFIVLVCTPKVFALLKKRSFSNKNEKNPVSREVSVTTVH